jgi:1-acyl-sn-glycerol-3-phosphate acyltransferase
MAVEVAHHSPFYRKFGLLLFRIFLGLVYLTLGPICAKGKYRVPKTGGLLILANHISDCDPPTVQLACPRPTFFMAKSELFDIPFIGWALPKWGVFPVKRDTADRVALRFAVKVLQEGECLAIFPEGETSETGEMLPLKPGIAWIAKTARVPIICCGIVGTNRVMPYGKLIPRPSFGVIRATWGEPRSFGPEATIEEIIEWAEGQLRELTGQESH